MSSSTNSQQHTLKTGTVYKKISDFLCSNPTLDADPAPIKSKNTITNPYTNKKKRRYVDMIGDALYPSLCTTITGKCYNKLRKLENEMDVSIAKRHSFISSQLQQTNNTTYSHNVTRILRLELFNTFHINPQHENKNKWIFKLQTKLFDPKDMSQPINAANNGMEYHYYHPLQAIISRIQIKLEKHSDIEWNNPNWSFHDKNAQFMANDTGTESPMDGIQIERYGNQNCCMDIFIYLINWFIPFEKQGEGKKKKQIHANHNAICKVSKKLSFLLGLGLLSQANGANKGHERYHTKAEILQCLGYYVRSNNLLRNDNSMAIDCNVELEKIIGAKTIYCANLWKVLVSKKHICRPDPIHIKHEICVQGNIEQNAKIYDILVSVPSLIAMKASKLMEGSRDLYNIHAKANDNYALTIDSLNVQISDVLEEINDERKERNLYVQYASDPVSSIDVIVSNQEENLQIIQQFCQNANVKPSQFFANSSVYSDIKRYLKKRQIENNNND